MEKKIAELRKIFARFIILILLMLLFVLSLPFAHAEEALLFDEVVHIMDGLGIIWL